MKRSIVLLFLLIVLLAGTAAAQYRQLVPFVPRFEVFGHLGAQVESIDGETATDLCGGGSFGVYLTRNLEVEFDLDFAGNFERDIAVYLGGDQWGLARETHQDFWAEFNVLYHFGDVVGFRPYVVAGLGNVHRSFKEIVEDPAAVIKNTSNNLGGSFGGGAKIGLARHVNLRAEYKISRADGTTIHRFRGGLAFEF